MNSEHPGGKGRSEQLEQARFVVGRLSHNISNPLASIVAGVHLLKQRLPEEGQLAEIVDEVLEDVHRLDRVVADLLEPARLTEMRAYPGPLAPLLDDLAGALRRSAADEGARLELAHPEGLEGEGPLVEMDPTHIERVIEHLVSNGAEAAGEGGVVRLRWERLPLGKGPALPPDLHRRWIVLRVSDDGPGIEAHRLDGIFDAFRTTKPSRVGLGLTLAAGVVEAHGGVIEVSSRPGVETEFSVFLPEA